MSSPQVPSPDRREEYQRQFTVAAGALAAAISTGVTDGGEVISHLLATVAANLGGMHAITQARPGSWEASYVDQMLQSTVGYDGDYLLEYRTHPIEVVESIDLVLFGADLLDVYDESLILIDTVEGDACNAGDEAANQRFEEAERLLDELRAVDYATYRQQYERNIRAAADELVRTRHLPADIPVRVRWVSWAQSEQTTRAREEWGTVEHQLYEQADAATPLPGFDTRIDWSKGKPVDQLHAAGRLPHQRIPQLAHYTDSAETPLRNQPPSPDRTTPMPETTSSVTSAAVPLSPRSGRCVTGAHDTCTGRCAGVECTCRCHHGDQSHASGPAPRWRPRSIWCATARHDDCTTSTFANACGCSCHDSGTVTRNQPRSGPAVPALATAAARSGEEGDDA
ncbi:MAG: hypothetical protein GEU83_20820 [Pseudonocardiaceae bacterium]|nr:hypothetical protein [Pseudonocardiaceae bacterium]